MLGRKRYADVEIIRGLRIGNAETPLIEGFLYDQYLSWIKYGQNKHRLSESGSLDSYIDAFADLVKKIRSGGFEENKAIAPLFKTIFDRKCVDHIRMVTNKKNKGTVAIEELFGMSDKAKSALDQLITTDFMSKIRPIVDTLNQNCRDIIHFWSHGYAHKEIAELLPTVSNDKSSKAILAKCLKKIRSGVDFSR